MTKGTAIVICGLVMLSACFDQASQQESSQRTASTRRVNKNATSESLNTRDATSEGDVADPHEHDDAPVDVKEKDGEPSVQAPVQAPMPTPTPTPDPASMPALVEFKIKAGTGTGAWNDASTTIKLKVGQTLKITNDDAVDHLLHTGEDWQT